MSRSRLFRSLSAVHVAFLCAFIGFGCASILGTQEKSIDTSGYGAIADAKGMIGFISGDYLSVPSDVIYFRYCRVETSGFFNSASKNIKESVVVSTHATNHVFEAVCPIIDACRSSVCTNNSDRAAP